MSISIESVKARPVVKWAGGKRQLLPQLLASQPSSWTHYWEPFVGGGALFFALAPAHAVISDINAEIVTLYRVIRDAVEDLIRDLTHHRNDADYFYQLRAQDPSTLSPVEQASRTVFLNKTCFNGLFRVNRQGQFNVPFGRYAHPNIVNAPGLRAAHHVLQTTEIVHADYLTMVDHMEPGAFVYCDSPYEPRSTTAHFTAYTATGFGWADQVRLAAAVHTLAARGVSVLVSHADSSAIRMLYRGLWAQTVKARRAINANGAKRGGATELIISTYPILGATRLR